MKVLKVVKKRSTIQYLPTYVGTYWIFAVETKFYFCQNWHKNSAETWTCCTIPVIRKTWKNVGRYVGIIIYMYRNKNLLSKFW